MLYSIRDVNTYLKYKISSNEMVHRIVQKDILNVVYKNRYWHFRGFYAFNFLSQGTKVTCELFKTEMISSPSKFLMFKQSQFPHNLLYSLHALYNYSDVNNCQILGIRVIDI